MITTHADIMKYLKILKTLMQLTTEGNVMYLLNNVY